jgi:cytochrome b pre-mRNA-processing protein 3
MLLIPIKKRRATSDAARALYSRAVEQARNPIFYARFGVPDSLDGRFDMVTLHVYLILRRLRDEGKRAERLAQRLFDLMFDDMDMSLRELGVGDLGVGRRVKAMAKALYGRIGAYDAGLDGDDATLAAALARNLYGTASASPSELAALCRYVRREAHRLKSHTFEALSAGRIAFGTLDDLTGTEA